MSGLLNVIERLATWRGMAVLLVLYAAVFGLIIVTVNQLSDVTGGYSILDFEPGYDKARVMEVLCSYGPQGMALNARVQFLDLFNPALYSLIAAALTILVWRGRGPRWLALVPLLGGLGDYMENVTLFVMARRFPDLSDGLVNLSSTLSLVKQGLLPIAVAPLLVGLVLWLWSLARKRQS